MDNTNRRWRIFLYFHWHIIIIVLVRVMRWASGKYKSMVLCHRADTCHCANKCYRIIPDSRRLICTYFNVIINNLFFLPRIWQSRIRNRSFGRRKSWQVKCISLIGVCLGVVYSVHNLGDEPPPFVGSHAVSSNILSVFVETMSVWTCHYAYIYI